MEKNRFGLVSLTSEKLKEMNDTITGRLIRIKDIKVYKFYDERKNEIDEKTYNDYKSEGIIVGRRRVSVGRVATLVVLNELDEKVYINLNTSFGKVLSEIEKDDLDEKMEVVKGVEINEGDLVTVTGIISENTISRVNEKGKMVYRKASLDETNTITQYRMSAIIKIEKVS